MVSFSKLLNEALEQTNEVSMGEFIKFVTALIASTSVDKIPVAIERAMAMPSGELVSVVKQVQFTGDTKALEDAIVSKPEYAAQFVELGRKVLPEEELLAMMEKMRPLVVKATPAADGRSLLWRADGGKAICPVCNTGELDWLTQEQSRSGGGGTVGCRGTPFSTSPCDATFSHCEYCDKWYQTKDYNYGASACNNCVRDSEIGSYNTEGDYHNQSKDLIEPDEGFVYDEEEEDDIRFWMRN